MKWKENAREKPSSAAAFQRDLSEATLSFAGEAIRLNHGKPLVTRTHVRDFIEADEQGNRAITVSMTFREGCYIFPRAYLHPKRKFVGETKDVRFKQGRGWEIYLDAVLRDTDGNPVLVNGQEIDMSAWYLESELKDAGLGMEIIRPGSTIPSINQIEENRSARIRRNTGRA